MLKMLADHAATGGRLIADMVKDGTRPNNYRVRILHADPARDILRITAEELTVFWGDGLEIRSFTDGEMAARSLLLAPDFCCNLALIDAGLREPGDALELIRIVRDCNPRCPVILTHYEDAQVDRRLLATGTHLLQKPFGIERLSEVIERLLHVIQIERS